MEIKELPKLLTEIKQTKKFKPDPIDDSIIGQILYAASKAPSAGNITPWKFIVVKDEEIKKNLAKAALHQSFIKDAPVVIVVCGDLDREIGKYGTRGEKLYLIQDTSYASMLIFLACKALDLGCYLVRAFDENSVKEILEIPENIRPFTIIPIGYKIEEPELEEYRVPYEESTYLNKYGNKFKEEFQPIEEKIKKIIFKRLRKEKVK
jgi:nitroreductase